MLDQNLQCGENIFGKCLQFHGKNNWHFPQLFRLHYGWWGPEVIYIISLKNLPTWYLVFSTLWPIEIWHDQYMYIYIYNIHINTLMYRLRIDDHHLYLKGVSNSNSSHIVANKERHFTWKVCRQQRVLKFSILKFQPHCSWLGAKKFSISLLKFRPYAAH